MIDTATIANGTRQWYCRSIVPLGDILKYCNVLRGATISVPDFECLYLFTNFKNNQWNYTQMNSRQIHFLHPMQQLLIMRNLTQIVIDIALRLFHTMILLSEV